MVPVLSLSPAKEQQQKRHWTTTSATNDGAKVRVDWSKFGIGNVRMVTSARQCLLPFHDLGCFIPTAAPAPLTDRLPLSSNFSNQRSANKFRSDKLIQINSIRKYKQFPIAHTLGEEEEDEHVSGIIWTIRRKVAEQGQQTNFPGSVVVLCRKV